MSEVFLVICVLLAILYVVLKIAGRIFSLAFNPVVILGIICFLILIL